MECLSNLRYLGLNACGQKMFATGILPKLPHLQVLVLQQPGLDGFGVWRAAPVTVKGKEVAYLRKLETEDEDK
jgi:disease resistance protein RPS2